MKVTTDGKRFAITELSRHDARVIASALANQAQRGFDEARRDNVVNSLKRIVLKVGREMNDLAESIMNTVDADL